MNVKLKERIAPKAKHSFDLADGVEGQLTLATGELVTVFENTDVGDVKIPLIVSHAHTKSNEDLGMGKGWRLSLHQRLDGVTTGNDDEPSEFVYIDAVGEKHTFTEYYFYEDTDGRKERVTKDQVVVALDGYMTVDIDGQVYEVERDFECDTMNAHLSTKINDLTGVKFLEQRNENERQLNDQIKNIEENLRDVVAIDSKTLDLDNDDFVMHKLSEDNSVENLESKSKEFLSALKDGKFGNDTIILEKSGIAQIDKLIMQRRLLNRQKESITSQDATLGIQHNLLNTQHASLSVQQNTIQQQRSALELQHRMLETQETSLTNQRDALFIQDEALQIQHRQLASQRRGMESQSRSLHSERDRLSRTFSCPNCASVTSTFAQNVANAGDNTNFERAREAAQSYAPFTFSGGVTRPFTSSVTDIHRCNACSTEFPRKQTELNHQRNLLGAHLGSSQLVSAGGEGNVFTQAALINQQQNNIGSTDDTANSQRNALRIQREDINRQLSHMFSQLSANSAQDLDLATQQDNISNQQADIRIQQADISRQREELTNQQTDIDLQLNNARNQFSLIIKQGRRRVSFACDMIIDYVNTLEQRRKFLKQHPKAVLIGEGTILGFGENGRFNTIFNDDENYTSIVWGEIETNAGRQDRIISVEVNEKVSVLNYDRDGLLESLTCYNGQRVIYSYYDGLLSEVEYCGLDEKILIKYAGADIVQVENTYTKLISEMSYENNRLTGLSNQSYIDKISDSEVLTLAEPKEVTKTKISYSVDGLAYASYIVIDVENENSMHYYLNFDGSLSASFSKNCDGSFTEKPSFSLLLGDNSNDIERRGKLWGYSVNELEGYDYIEIDRNLAVEGHVSITAADFARFEGITEFVVSASTTIGKHERLERSFHTSFRPELDSRAWPHAFTLIATVRYEGFLPERFIGSFDSRIASKQFLALPITIDKTKRLSSIAIQQWMPFTHPLRLTPMLDDIRFTPCEWSYFEEDEWGNETYTESSEQLIAKANDIWNYNKTSNGVKQFIGYEDTVLTPFKPLNTEAKVFDSMHRLIREQVTNRTTKINSRTRQVISCEEIHTVNTQTYNDDGDVVRQESWILGEEAASGKNIQEVVYDEDGNLTEEISYNSLDSSSKFIQKNEYKENGQVSAKYDESGKNKNKFEYDELSGQIKTAQTADGAKFGFGYNWRGRVTAITQSTEEGEANTTRLRFVSGLRTRLSAGRNSLTYEFDYQGRRNSVSLNGQERIRHEYEENYTAGIGIATIGGKVFGQLENFDIERKILSESRQKDGGEAQSITGEAWTDKRGRICMVGIGGEVMLAHSYNNDNSVAYTGDGATGSITEYVYDEVTKNNVKVIRSKGETIAVPAAIETVSYNDYGLVNERTVESDDLNNKYQYTYKDNAAKDLESITLPKGFMLKPEMDVYKRNCGKEIFSESSERIAGEYITYRKHGVNATNMVASIRYGSKPDNEYVIKDGLSYKYDQQGNISEIRENGQLQVRYSYDTVGRLIREDNASLNKTILHSYDNNGNILSKRVGKFSLREDSDRLQVDTVAEYEYSADNGDLLKNIAIFSGGNDSAVKNIRYNEVGRPLSYQDNDIEWEKGRIVKFGDLNYVYDGHGRRIEKSDLNGDSIKYVYDNSGYLIRQINNANAVAVDFIRENTTLIGLIFEGKEYFYRQNFHGDITHLLDSDGKIVVKYSYDAWGNHVTTALSGYESLAKSNPYRYRGYIWDAETGLYYTSQRYYDPTISRFISPDSIENAEKQAEFIGGINLYAFCINNPISYIDPSGGIIISIITGLVIGIFVGGIVVGGIAIAGQVINSGSLNPFNWDWDEIGVAALRGAFFGGIMGAFKPFALAAKGLKKAFGLSKKLASNAIGAAQSTIANTMLKGAATGLKKAGDSIVNIAKGSSSKAKASINKIKQNLTAGAGKKGVVTPGVKPSFEVLGFRPEAIMKASAQIKWKGVMQAPSYSTFKKKLFKHQRKLTPKLFKKKKFGKANAIKGNDVILHHVKGRAGKELYNVVGVTKKQHLAIHQITGYKNAAWDAVSYVLTNIGGF